MIQIIAWENLDNEARQKLLIVFLGILVIVSVFIFIPLLWSGFKGLFGPSEQKQKAGQEQVAIEQKKKAAKPGKNPSKNKPESAPKPPPRISWLALYNNMDKLESRINRTEELLRERFPLKPYQKEALEKKRQQIRQAVGGPIPSAEAPLPPAPPTPETVPHHPRGENVITWWEVGDNLSQMVQDKEQFLEMLRTQHGLKEQRMTPLTSLPSVPESSPPSDSAPRETPQQLASLSAATPLPPPEPIRDGPVGWEVVLDTLQQMEKSRNQFIQAVLPPDYFEDKPAKKSAGKSEEEAGNGTGNEMERAETKDAPSPQPRESQPLREPATAQSTSTIREIPLPLPGKTVGPTGWPAVWDTLLQLEKHLDKLAGVAAGKQAL